jgi:cytochrome c oxidase cbb3-type subunit 2
MNFGPLIFLAAFITLAVSWCGMVLAPQLQLGRQMPVVRPMPNPDYPVARPGLAQQGLQVYRSLGCAECHTQQVRPESADTYRGWGKRRTVAADFLYDQPVLTGSLRLGPDLANLATREPLAFAVPWKFATTNHLAELEHLLYRHLYSPRLTAPGSTMPAYRFLFEERELKTGQELEPLAFKLNDPAKGELPGKQVVPKREAQALVAYLLSLQADVSLFEAPIVKLEIQPLGTNAPAAAATNAAAGAATNAPAP